VFERFTDRARRVVVLAQEEARLLNHNYIGSEHILLGLIREGEGVAAKTLESLDIALDDVRRQVEAIIGHGDVAPSGHIPFTARAKKTLELSLREALQLGHNYIGTEHILLGLIREGEGVGAQVLVKLGADLSGVRERVIQLLSGFAASRAVAGTSGPNPSFGASRLDLAVSRSPFVRACSFCSRDLWEAEHYVRGETGAICDACIAAANQVVGAAKPDQHVVFLPASIYGTEPERGAADAIGGTIQQTFATVDAREMIACVEERAELLEATQELLARHGSGLAPFVVRVERIRFLDDVHAVIRIAHTAGEVTVDTHEMSVVRRDGRWLIGADSFLFAVETMTSHPM
jgi:hypothetical protein